MSHRRHLVLAVLGLLAAALVPLAAAPPAAADGTVTVTVTGPGSVSGDGIDCNQSGGPDCSEFYPNESTCQPEDPPPCFMVSPHVTLTAAPGSGGYTFIEWTGCTSASGLQCNVTVASNRTINARYGDVTPPTVSPPTPSSGVHRGTITLAATANDAIGLKRVEFYNGPSLLGSDTTAPYSLSWNTASVDDGVKNLTARAVDTSDNATTSGASSITVDNTAPALTVDSGPNGQTFGAGTTQTWSFTATDANVDTVECSVVPAGRAPSYGACSAAVPPRSHSVSGLGDGAYEFSVRVEDKTSHVVSASRSFSIDGVPPGTSVESGPVNGARIKVRSVRFGLASTEAGGTFTCRLYASGTTAPAFVPCSAPASHATTGLADGGYVFQAVATDQFGNTDITPVTRTFTVDTVAPQTTIRSGPASVVSSSGSTARSVFAFSSERLATFRCKLDARAWRACTSRPAYVVGLGAHTLRVAAVDRAGNVDRTPAVRRWTVRRR